MYAQDRAHHINARAMAEQIATSALRKTEQLAAAVVSLACRLEGHARTLQEVSVSSGVDASAISATQGALARELHLDTGRVAPEQVLPRIVSHPLVVFAPFLAPTERPERSEACSTLTMALTMTSLETTAADVCRQASETGVLDGVAPQAAAVAALVFAATSVILANDRARRQAAAAAAASSSSSSSSSSSKPSSSSSSSLSNAHPSSSSSAEQDREQPEPFATPASVAAAAVLDDDYTDHFPVNVAKAVEAAMTTLATVGRAYAALQLYAEHVLPPAVKQAVVRAGKVRDWAALMPPFDAVARRSAAALLVYKQHHFRRHHHHHDQLPRTTAAGAHGGSGMFVRQPFNNARTYVQHSMGPAGGGHEGAKKRPRDGTGDDATRRPLGRRKG